MANSGAKERRSVPEGSHEEIVISAEALELFITDLYLAVGARAEDAALVAHSLVDANLRGVDSHGVLSLPDYLAQATGGDVEVKEKGRVVKEVGACLLYDAADGLGQVTAAICCEHAARLARAYGLGMVVARNAAHFGAASYWARRITGEGLMAMVLCNASPRVPPWQGVEARLGTNPICVALPGEAGKLWLLDMATTTAAAGKVYLAAMRGETTVPEGWALNAQGEPTTDLQEALRGLWTPLGGYKGYGLSMMVEMLCGVISGGAFSTDVAGIRMRGRRSRATHTFLAIDVTRFLPQEELDARVAALVGRVKSARPAEGYSEVLVAGEPESRMEEQRRREGIPIPSALWQQLAAWARAHEVAVPDVELG